MRARRTERPVETGPAVPDLAQPIGGWRVWRLSLGDGVPTLHAPVRGTPWPARAETTATCPARCRQAPTPGCACGLYALGDLPVVRRWSLDGSLVLGCTALWGRVLEGTDGWRAERGYPLVLLVPAFLCEPDPFLTRLRRLTAPDLDAELDAADTVERVLAARYGVPVYGMPRSPAGLFRRSADLLARAVAVRDEAVRGLPGRREGEPGARERLDRAVADLVASMAG
jgi:hypothetical protein